MLPSCGREFVCSVYTEGNNVMIHNKYTSSDVLRIFNETPDRDVLIHFLTTSDSEIIESVRQAAEETLLSYCGNRVYYRGLIEFSNNCALDCAYCGIRRSNKKVSRYTVSEEEIVKAARWCADVHYGSLVLQS